jgi:hypothetical protein
VRPMHGSGTRVFLDSELTPGQLRAKEEFDAAFQEALDDFSRVHPWEADRSPRISACGHPQPPPGIKEIREQQQVIVRECTKCGRDLWWNVDRWRLL